MVQYFSNPLNIAVVFPDTSARQVDDPEIEPECLNGSGMYVDADTQHYNKYFNMFSYVNHELQDIIQLMYSNRLDTNAKSITGFSMGGHGALLSYLKNNILDNNILYRSVSAISPICNAAISPWGRRLYPLYFNDQ